MPLTPSLVPWLKSRGHDAVHAAALGLERAADTIIIARAVAEDRSIITADLDYPRLLAIAGATAPSVILFRGGNWSDIETINRMRQLLDSMHEDDFARSIVVVDKNRIRRHRLPLV
jgi:predicted nuclease of predicted toxin-antitoxin system